MPPLTSRKVLIPRWVQLVGLPLVVLGAWQFISAVSHAVFIFVLFLTWALSKVVDPPYGTLISYFSLYEKHFFPLMRGLLQLSDVVYFASLTYLALLASTRVIQSQRWQ